MYAPYEYTVYTQCAHSLPIATQCKSTRLKLHSAYSLLSFRRCPMHLFCFRGCFHVVQVRHVRLGRKTSMELIAKLVRSALPVQATLFLYALILAASRDHIPHDVTLVARCYIQMAENQCHFLRCGHEGIPHFLRTHSTTTAGTVV